MLKAEITSYINHTELSYYPIETWKEETLSEKNVDWVDLEKESGLEKAIADTSKSRTIQIITFSVSILALAFFATMLFSPLFGAALITVVSKWTLISGGASLFGIAAISAVLARKQHTQLVRFRRIIPTLQNLNILPSGDLTKSNIGNMLQDVVKCGKIKEITLEGLLELSSSYFKSLKEKNVHFVKDNTDKSGWYLTLTPIPGIRLSQ